LQECRNCVVRYNDYSATFTCLWNPTDHNGLGRAGACFDNKLENCSLASAALLLFFIYIIRRRAGLVSDAPLTLIVKVLSWLVTAFSALNFLGILASLSSGEKILFGPISFLLLVACILVSLSKSELQTTTSL